MFKRENLKLILSFSILLHLVASVNSVGYHHRDEHYQIIEFAGLKTGINQRADLAWEYNERVRPAIQPALAYLIIETSDLIGISNPFDQTMIMRILSSLFSIICMYLLFMAFEDEIKSSRLKAWFLFLSFFLCFFFYLQVRFSSENWSGLLFFTGFALYFYKKYKHTSLFLISIGLLLGLSFLFRYQSGFLILGFMLWLLFVKKEKFKNLIILFSGIIAAILIGIFIDRWFYNEWTITIWNYFNVNIIQGKASGFGTQPWYFYITETLKQGLPPFSIFLILGFLILFIGKYKSVFTWTLLPFILVHFIIGHKEFRFLFPILNVVPIIVVLSIREILLVRDKYISIKFKILFRKVYWNWLIYLFVIVNTVYLIIVCIRPADIYVALYKFIYNNYNNEKTVLLYMDKDPYLVTPEPANFYKSRKLETIKYSDSINIDSLYAKDNKVIFLSESYSDISKLKFSNIEMERVYRTIPGWMDEFNFNHWLERTKVFSLYELDSTK